MKLCLLYIINKEDYLCEDTFMKMFNNKYDDTTTDIKDVEKCIDSIKKLDKKGFTYCISSAFTLFENNLLKGLQKVYKEKEEAAKNEEENKDKKDNKTINEIKEEPKDIKPKSQAEDDDIL